MTTDASKSPSDTHETRVMPSTGAKTDGRVCLTDWLTKWRVPRNVISGRFSFAYRGLMLWVVVAASSAIAGAIYAIAWGQLESFVGAIYGLSTGLLAVLTERAVCLHPLRERLRRLPTFLFFSSGNTTAINDTLGIFF
jgi:hypothetical protein